MNRIGLLLLGVLCAARVNAFPVNGLPFTGVIESFPLENIYEFDAANFDFEGIVALNNCSGSLVRFERSRESDPAMVLTNGHCMEGGGFIQPGAHVFEKTSGRTFTLLSRTARPIGRVRAKQILYGTMTKTDMALYQLETSFEKITSEYNVKPMTLANRHAVATTAIEVISGFWKKGYQCNIDKVVHKLKEGGYTFEQSVRYSLPGCETIPGTSGSPIIANGTKTVIAINNTGNEDGQECTMNNPCEEDNQGRVFFQKGLNYGQQISDVYGCLTGDNKIDLTLNTCRLPH